MPWAAILYRYVTGEKLPAYYERINEEKESTPPQQMQTRIMDFQSEAIMKAASIYDFDRYEDLETFRKALLPSDMDMDSLYSEQETTKTLKRKPFWYAYEQKKLHRYYAVIAALLLVAVIVLGPRLYQVGLDIRINHFMINLTTLPYMNSVRCWKIYPKSRDSITRMTTWIWTVR